MRLACGDTRVEPCKGSPAINVASVSQATPPVALAVQVALRPMFVVSPFYQRERSLVEANGKGCNDSHGRQRTVVVASAGRRRTRAIIALVLSLFGKCCAEDCETLTVRSNHGSVNGTYSLIGDHNGRPMFKGPNGDILRYELHTAEIGDVTNAGARDWLHADGWFIVQAGVVGYGLGTSLPMTHLSSLSAGSVVAEDWKTPDGRNAFIDITCTGCVSTPAWTDGTVCTSGAQGGCTDAGWTCKAFAMNGWCSGGAPVKGKDAFFGRERGNPEHHCCACGGSWKPTVDDALRKLAENQNSVRKLEDTLEAMRKGLSAAEKSLADAADRTSRSRKIVLNLEKTSKANEFEAWQMSRHVASLGTTLKLDDDELLSTNADAKQVVTASNEWEHKAAKTNDRRLLISLERLNKRIWQVAESSDRDSLIDEENRVQVVEDQARTFRSRLEARVRAVSTTQLLKSKVAAVRKQLYRLGRRCVFKQAWVPVFDPVTGRESLVYMPC
eukprot:TRINITY_DN67349_c0_g1_i1.p1 TRINITY_DN67349_c0_g1~~TRINITY_DN67349_c0_g1_i1.p1  ORF type:complete len:499 (-),score=67.64 TRINITY_DN67349_c0_g1_i1:47-1543(-)